MLLSSLLEMSDEEVFELVDEEYKLSEKQAALYEIMHDMMDHLDKLKQNEERTKLEIKRLKTENESLRTLIKENSR